MNLAQQINRHGFRRWYEHQLVVGHLHLLGGFLALIAMLAGLETLDVRAGPASALMLLALTAACGVVALASWRRFMELMARAEVCAGNATCPACGAWGRLRALGAEPSARAPRWVSVCCKTCNANWQLETNTAAPTPPAANKPSPP